MYSLDDGKKLIALARHSIETAFTKTGLNLLPYKQFSEKQGVFVTLKKEGELRGCIGYIEPTYELYKGVVRAARAAAFEDPRFERLKENELNEITIEISILTKPQLIRVRNPDDYLKEIRIGIDGLMIKAGVYSGVLLPQVAVEYNWDAERFLRHLCIKAGISMDAWRDLHHPIYSYLYIKFIDSQILYSMTFVFSFTISLFFTMFFKTKGSVAKTNPYPTKNSQTIVL